MKKVLKGFTLAEVMIVLTVIGILAGILIPVANNSRPDENVMKFKKAHATLANVIHELVTSDKYYQNGDLGTKQNGKLIDGTNDGDYSYFCQSFADLVLTKKVNCITTSTSTTGYWLASNESADSLSKLNKLNRTTSSDTINSTKAKFDSVCASSVSAMGEEIITSDNVVFYQAGTVPFGKSFSAAAAGKILLALLEPCLEGWNRNPDGLCCLPGEENCFCHGTSNNDFYCDSEPDPDSDPETEPVSNSFRLFSSPNDTPAYIGDTIGLDIAYKIMCIDVDGINKGEDPFGYGIRADGKILTGARADVWLEKGFQKGKNDN